LKSSSHRCIGRALRRGRTAIGDMQQSRQIAVHNE
jgi:hypothetical protein